jgi:hypothetical protein
MKKTAGRWDPNDKSIYFVASNVSTLIQASNLCDHLLIAVNELANDEDLAAIERFAAQGKNVFIDSGVFNLANSHAKAHDITMDEALALAPDEIEGFSALFDRYCSLAGKFGDNLWGYIEIDQGGRENKIKTRKRLEDLGFAPIPVYHPFNDGWDYFDYLGENYDRICLGNIVQADRNTRKQLLATMWERRRKYPNLWIHVLGMTTNEWCHAYAPDSCDSSTWLSAVRWPAMAEMTALKPFTKLPANFRYRLEAEKTDPDGWNRAIQLCGYFAAMKTTTWRVMQNELRAIGCEPRLHS